MPIIEVSGLRKAYGGRPAVDGVTFAVEEGEIFGILGPNGAGKTTTVECLEGLREADAGTVRVAGLDPRADRAELTGILGVQLQESELQEKLTVREALELYSAFYPDPADWRELAERLGITGKLAARFGKLSGGQKQRLFIALALIAAVAEGQTLIHDWVYENRAIYLVELNKLGGQVKLLDPHRVMVEGPTRWTGTEIVCPPALRPAVVVLLAMLASKGTSVLRSTYVIHRGYEDLAERLNQLGAQIETFRDL
jgi:ABC-type branched-subunit amino acid transport system ATPase component